MLRRGNSVALRYDDGFANDDRRRRIFRRQMRGEGTRHRIWGRVQFIGTNGREV